MRHLLGRILCFFGYHDFTGPDRGFDLHFARCERCHQKYRIYPFFENRPRFD